MGSFTLGFATDDNKGKKGRWTMNPYVFDILISKKYS